jgi:proteasome lid subunit RPN8/RPN11
MMDKVHYFLKTFSNLEWSGPAWYSHVKDENGFPSIVTLEYFHPLHLGTASATDWEGEELMKIYKPLRKEFPEIGKSWVQGNIHSHHTMGAFFSGTDIQQCIDGANENFYYSLVVSTKPGKELHFGTSYPDQFGQVHVVEFDDIEVESNIVENKIWKSQASLIRKRKKKEDKTTTYFNTYNNHTTNGQATLFGSNKPTQNTETKQQRYEDHIDWLSYNGAHNGEYDWRKFDAYDDIMLDYENGKIKKATFEKKLKKLGVDEYGRALP